MMDILSTLKDSHDDDYNLIGTETLRERLIRIKGIMNDEEDELEDLYYGATRHGWKFVKKLRKKTLTTLEK